MKKYIIYVIFSLIFVVFSQSSTAELARGFGGVDAGEKWDNIKTLHKYTSPSEEGRATDCDWFFCRRCGMLEVEWNHEVGKAEARIENFTVVWVKYKFAIPENTDIKRLANNVVNKHGRPTKWESRDGSSGGEFLKYYNLPDRDVIYSIKDNGDWGWDRNTLSISVYMKESEGDMHEAVSDSCSRRMREKDTDTIVIP
ncbi:MAG: hypothetical protein KJO08_04000 [Gammaproteobacteria bacterium]|nr:hypothetical protein [Gammaproteobacteria bacterium]